MPKLNAGTSKTDLARRVAASLRNGLDGAGFPVEAIETEPIKGTKLFRVTLVAKGLDKLWVSERQDLVWRMLAQSFSAQEQMRISMVVALAPPEVVGV
jgi:hypothetical protein